MTAHIRVPELTGDDPATFSRAALEDLLRGEYGFAGAIVTDALEMKGAAEAAGGIGPGAVRALAAGADLLCIGADVDGPLVERVAADIVDAIAGGRLPVSRVESAAARGLELSEWTRATAVAEEAQPDLGYVAARRAVRVEGSVSGFEAPLVVQLESPSTIAEGRVPWGLGPHIDAGEPLRVVAGEVSPDALIQAAGDRPIVLVGRHTHRQPGAPQLVERLAAQHRQPVALVEMGWPSTWRPAGVRAFVTTYGASHANGRAAAEALGLRP
jgi:beta-N-acetylhexosaminidase